MRSCLVRALPRVPLYSGPWEFYSISESLIDGSTHAEAVWLEHHYSRPGWKQCFCFPGSPLWCADFLISALISEMRAGCDRNLSRDS
jgi:hypothetical protein